VTPKEALHAFCHYCVQSRYAVDIENCGGCIDYATGKECVFYPYRMGKRPRMRVFRQFCLSCMGGNMGFVRECETSSCLLHRFRCGKNPSISGASKIWMAKIRSRNALFSTVKKSQDQFLSAGQ
jgi:hypothetical protein